MGKMAMYYGKTLKVKPFGLMTDPELPTKKLATKLDTKSNNLYYKLDTFLAVYKEYADQKKKR
jgi:hypothetical protein